MLAALGLGLIVFLVRPLFSRNLGEMLRGISLAGLWRGFARGLSQALDTALAGLRRLLSAPRDVAGRLAATVTRAARERRRQARARRAVRSRLRQGAHGAAVRGFVRLIRWGERSGVPFRRSVAPLDYVRALARGVARAARGAGGGGGCCSRSWCTPRMATAASAPPASRDRCATCCGGARERPDDGLQRRR